MSEKRLKRKIIKKKLFTKNRLVILNEETFEEVFSLRLTLMNVFVVASIGALLIIFITTYIIAFTPLRQYIPGYASTKLKQDAMNLAIQSDSLETIVNENKAYIASIKKVLTGDIEYAKFNKDSIIAAEKQNINEQELLASEAENELLEKVKQEDKYNVFETSKPKVSFVLFPPVEGKIIEKYNAKNKHLAVTIALANNTPVKSVATGTIVFAEWTPSSGYVVIIRHQDAILSVYKNVGTLTKKQGDVVKSGEVVGLAGNSINPQASITLHFELWKDGYPIDPTQFINFE